ncbi:MAG: cobalamin-binding protein [Candidatus Melainabacteria bacterium]|nr:cobalamin-binding protein [Candidatus Melainabacteria bacterium]
MTNRIVSLIASATEIVYALGFGSELVGRSHECDYPPQVKDLPQCTSPKFKTDGTSYEIDQRVKAILQEAVSVYRVDAALLDELAPSHIITQAQCEVCAVSLKDVEAAACDMIKSQPKIVSLEPNCLEDIWSDIDRVASALGAKQKGVDLVHAYKERMSDIQNAAAKIQTKPTVACIEWIEPLMAAGNWMPELIEMAGGVNLYGEAGKHSPWMTWEQVENDDPDFIVVTPCGFDIKRTLEEMHLLSDKPSYKSLKAVKAGHVYVADGNQYFNRPGPRAVESLEIMAEILHPTEFNFGHEGTGWIKYSAAVQPATAH